VTSGLRTGTAILAASVVVGGIALALAAHVHDVTDLPLSPDHLGFTGVPIELAFTADETAARTRRVQVATDIIGQAGWLDAADELHIVFATFVTEPALRSAELRDGTGRCRFTAPPGATLSNNLTTRFVKTGQCDATTPGPLMLDLRVGLEGRVALWTYDVAQSDPVSEGLALVDTRTSDRMHLLRGRVTSTRNADGPRRAAMLAYLWTGRMDPAGIWIAVGLAWIGLAAGLIWLVSHSASQTGVVGGAFLAAAALAGLWAVLLPPLQGADEPDHLLSYLEVVHQPALNADLQMLARRTHFERIRFHGGERFRPIHVGAPHDTAWNANVHAERMDRRSPLAMALWRVADATIARPDGLSAAGLVLRLRLFNAIIFALAIGAAAGLMTWGTTSRWPLAGLAVIPSLASFGVAFSDWAFVTSGAVLLAGATVAVLTDRGPEWVRGLTFGGAVAWIMAASIAGLALVPLLAAVLLARLVLGSARSASAQDTVAFWLGLTAGVVAGAWISWDLFELGYARYDQKAGSGRLLLDAVNTLLGRLVAAPWLLLLLPVAAALIERGLRRLHPWSDVVSAGHRLVMAGAVLVSAGTVGVLAASAFIALPTLPPMEVMTYDTLDGYVTQVLVVFITSLRLTNIDFLMFSSFWSGFGWLDTMLPTAWLAVLAAGSALGLAVGLGDLFRARAYRRLAWTLALLVGALGSLVALGLAGGMMNRNVHGRYLIGMYVPLIVLAWSGWSGLAARPGLTGTLARAVLAVGLVILQTFVFVFVMARYY
jgi:hypothetical protein